MDFGLSEEQVLFEESLRGYLREHVPIERVRTIMESGRGGDDGLNEELARQGVAGMLVPEQYGGSGLGMLEAAVAAEQLGAGAVPCSFHSAWVMAPLALAAAGTEAQKARWLPAVAAGTALLSVARGRLRREGDVLSGSLAFVPDADSADAFIIVTDDDEWFLLPRDTAGLEVDQFVTIDATRRVGELMLGGVRTDQSMRLSNAPTGCRQRVVDAGRIALAADALGAAQRSLEEAVTYSLERTQFGRVIGSFQAVKHMCAEVAAEVEPVRSLMWYAGFAWDDQRDDHSRVAALLKAHATEVATRATTSAVQIYGGMGFTYECDMHIWFKRAGYDRQMLDGPATLREQAASGIIG